MDILTIWARKFRSLTICTDIVPATLIDTIHWLMINPQFKICANATFQSNDYYRIHIDPHIILHTGEIGFTIMVETFNSKFKQVISTYPIEAVKPKKMSHEYLNQQLSGLRFNLIYKQEISQTLYKADIEKFFIPQTPQYSVLEMKILQDLRKINERFMFITAEDQKFPDTIVKSGSKIISLVIYETTDNLSEKDKMAKELNIDISMLNNEDAINALETRISTLKLKDFRS